jgi:hypothetical protein
VLEDLHVRLRAEPKRSGIRWLAVLGPAAAEAYAAAVAPLVPTIEAALPHEVLANRVAAVHRSPARIELEDWEVARARFRRLVREGAPRAGAALMADVRDCYGSISAAIVAASLAALGCGCREVAAVVEVLERLAACGVRGLPIGPEPSAVLANAVLLPVDRALRDGGWPHLRWVDDVIVFTDGPEAAAEALERLTAAVAGLGLSVATSKTRVIVDPAAIRGAATGSGPAGRPLGRAATG